MCTCAVMKEDHKEALCGSLKRVLRGNVVMLVATLLYRRTV